MAAKSKPERCEQQIRVDMDDWERCKEKAVKFVGDGWYCESCAKFQQDHIDKREQATAQGVVVTQYGEILRPETPYKTPDTAISRNGGIIHHLCNGWVDLKTISEHFSAFHCRNCGLRVVVHNDHCGTWKAFAEACKRYLADLKDGAIKP